MHKRMTRRGWLPAAALSMAIVAAGRGQAATPAVQLDFNSALAGEQLELNGQAALVDLEGRQRLRLTEDFGEGGAAWLKRPVKLASYVAEFNFEVTRTDPADQPADGFTFTAQQYGPVALGDGGGGLGYLRIPGYNYAVEFNSYAPQGLPDQPETVAVDILGARVKLGQIAFPHVDQGVFHALIAVRRAAIDVTVSGGKANLPPKRLLTTPWWIQFVTDQPMWIGFTGATGGLRSVIDIFNLKITPLP